MFSDSIFLFVLEAPRGLVSGERRVFLHVLPSFTHALEDCGDGCVTFVGHCSTAIVSSVSRDNTHRRTAPR